LYAGVQLALTFRNDCAVILTCIGRHVHLQNLTLASVADQYDPGTDIGGLSWAFPDLRSLALERVRLLSEMVQLLIRRDLPALRKLELRTDTDLRLQDGG
jgi:hypothetical protein